MVSGRTKCIVLIVGEAVLGRAVLRESLDGILRDKLLLEASTPVEIEALLLSGTIPDVVFIEEALASDARFKDQLPSSGTVWVRIASNAPGKISKKSRSLCIQPPFEDETLRPFLQKIPRLRRHCEEVAHPLRRQNDAITLASGRKIQPTFVRDIILIGSLGNSCVIQSENGGGSTPKSLKFFEKALDPRIFLRIGKSHLINLRKVVSFRPMSNGCLHAELANGSALTVSRRRAPTFRRKLKSVLSPPPQDAAPRSPGIY